jgi:hypothetical protein
MASKVQPKAPKRTAVVRGKVGLRSSAIQKKLDKGTKFLNASKESTLATQLKPTADALQTAQNDLTTKYAAWKAAHDLAVSLAPTVAASSLAHTAALKGYVTVAQSAANGDPGVLTGAGVEQTAVRTLKPAQPAKMTHVSILPGTEPGDAKVKYTRPLGAASFEIQYKKDPALATDPWLPGDRGFITSALDYTITGLAPSGGVRLRIRPLGVVDGPWSDEVIGTAR